MSEASQNILIVVIVLLALGELTVLVLGIVILMKVKSIVKQAKTLVNEGHDLVGELNDRMKSRRSLVATSMWLVKHYKRRKKHG